MTACSGISDTEGKILIETTEKSIPWTAHSGSPITLKNSYGGQVSCTRTHAEPGIKLPILWRTTLLSTDPVALYKLLVMCDILYCVCVLDVLLKGGIERRKHR